MKRDYSRFTAWLRGKEGRSFATTFAEVGKYVDDKTGAKGVGLPDSARDHREWWGNDRTHTQAQAWMAADYETRDPDITTHTVQFVYKGR